MTDSSPDKLSPLQRAVLETFFRYESRFFLTGGAALAGFYLHHRSTLDLDLFTLDPEAFSAGRRTLDAVAADLGATVTVRQHAPGFERLVVCRADESVVVDLVLERVAQTAGPKRWVGSIAVAGSCRTSPSQRSRHYPEALRERSSVNSSQVSSCGSAERPIRPCSIPHRRRLPALLLQPVADEAERSGAGLFLCHQEALAIGTE